MFKIIQGNLSGWRDSNSRPHAPKARALPTAPHPDVGIDCAIGKPLSLFAYRFDIPPLQNSFRILTENQYPKLYQ